MAVIARPTKVAGGTSVVDGTIGYASDWNGDIDTIYSEFNGNITDTNIKAAASLSPTKLANVALHSQSSSPGDSSSENLPTTITEEIEQLRYQLWRLGVGVNAKYVATGNSAGWFNIPPKSHNLLLNPALLATQTSSGAPDFWSLVGTPTVTMTSFDTTHLGRHPMTQIAATGAQEGIQQTLTGLRPSTKYLVGCFIRMSVAGTFHLKTTGAATGTFDDLDLTRTSTSSYLSVHGIIQTDATPTDIVVQLVADSGGTANVVGPFVVECSQDPIEFFPGHNYTISSTLNDAARITTGAWNSIRSTGPTAMAFSQIARPHGTLVEVSAAVSVLKNTGAGEVRIRIFDGTNSVAEVGLDMAAAEQSTLVIPPTVIQTDITSLITLTLQGRCEANDADVNPASLVTGGTAMSWMTCKLVRA